MSNNDFDNSNFASYMTYRAGSEELSEQRYNLTIGAALTWGFFLNYLILIFAAPQMMAFLMRNSANYSGFMIGFLIAYFVLVLIGGRMVRSESAATCFIGYNLIAVPVGIVVALAVYGYDPMLVQRAVLLTAIVTLSMMIVSTVVPSLFASMGRGLSISLLITILVQGVSMLFFRADLAILDWVVITIMCLYIGYDWVRANNCQRTTTNAIAAASALYLDIINIFLRILRILSRNRSRN